MRSTRISKVSKPYFSLYMLKIEHEYITYCHSKHLDPLKEDTAIGFFEWLKDDKDKFYEQINEFKLKIDPRSIVGKLFSTVLVGCFEDVDFVFEIVALNTNETYTIFERKKRIQEIYDAYLEQHIYAIKKRNDLIVGALMITECLRAEDYTNAYKSCSLMFNDKYHNQCLFNFFRIYIDIFSNKEIDPQTEFDVTQFGTYPFLSDVLYYLYSLREENDEEAEHALNSIKEQSKELYFLFGLGFCTVKIDVISLPKYAICKKFGTIDPNSDYFAYKESIYTLILFLKIACDYCFKYFYQFEKKYNEEAVKFLNTQLHILSLQEKLLTVAIMSTGFTQFNTTSFIDMRISKVKQIIKEAAKEVKVQSDQEVTEKFFAKFLSPEESDIDQTLIDLENHGFISNLDFDNDKFTPEDELFIFTNAFSSGLMKSLKDNPNLFDSDDITEFSVDNNFDDDKPGNAS